MVLKVKRLANLMDMFPNIVQKGKKAVTKITTPAKRTSRKIIKSPKPKGVATSTGKSKFVKRLVKGGAVTGLATGAVALSGKTLDVVGEGISGLKQGIFGDVGREQDIEYIKVLTEYEKEKNESGVNGSDGTSAFLNGDGTYGGIGGGEGEEDGVNPLMAGAGILILGVGGYFMFRKKKKGKKVA
jgi:LPXTG-motif cell wall-anchored protein